MSLKTAIEELGQDEGQMAADQVLADWIVALDDMMEVASPEGLKAIAVLRKEIGNPSRKFGE